MTKCYAVTTMTVFRPLEAVTPDAGRERIDGCAAGTLVECDESDAQAMIAAGIAEEGPPGSRPSTAAALAAMVAGRSAAFQAACALLGHV